MAEEVITKYSKELKDFKEMIRLESNLPQSLGKFVQKIK
jgi:hypothetical protein